MNFKIYYMELFFQIKMAAILCWNLLIKSKKKFQCESFKQYRKIKTKMKT